MQYENKLDRESAAHWRDDNVCFLDDMPAKIIGFKCDFPTIAQLDGPLTLQWSWAGVNKIMNADRQFKSKP